MATDGESQAANGNSEIPKEQVAPIENKTAPPATPKEPLPPPTAAEASIALQEHPQHVASSDTK